VEKYLEPDRPQMTIWRMHTACWITKARNAYLLHVIFVAFPLHQWLQEGAVMLRYTYSILPVLSASVVRSDLT